MIDFRYFLPSSALDYSILKFYKMQIDAPPNLNPEETKCFNEIVRSQLEELYSYEFYKIIIYPKLEKIKADAGLI